MYHLAVTVSETVFGVETRAWLSDVDDSGHTVLVATEGPTARSPEEQPGDPLVDLLRALSRYATYLNGPTDSMRLSGVSEVLR